CLVGLVRAYQATAKVSRRAAIQAVIHVCRFEDFVFGAEQIKRWDRTFREQHEQGPDAFANEFVKRAHELDQPVGAGADQLGLEDRVLTIGRTWVWRLWAVPGATDAV